MKCKITWTSVLSEQVFMYNKCEFIILHFITKRKVTTLFRCATLNCLLTRFSKFPFLVVPLKAYWHTASPHGMAVALRWSESPKSGSQIRVGHHWNCAARPGINLHHTVPPVGTKTSSKIHHTQVTTNSTSCHPEGDTGVSQPGPQGKRIVSFRGPWHCCC